MTQFSHCFHELKKGPIYPVGSISLELGAMFRISQPCRRHFRRNQPIPSILHNFTGVQGKMDDVSSLSSNGEAGPKAPRTKIDGSSHPFVPKAEQPSIRKNEDGSWGPTGLYGSRVKETKFLNTLRSVIKPSRLKRVEEVLAARSKRVQCLFENLHDPANGAACLRSMEGFGVLNAHAVESYEPFKVSGGITMNAEKVRFRSISKSGLEKSPAAGDGGN